MHNKVIQLKNELTEGFCNWLVRWRKGTKIEKICPRTLIFANEEPNLLNIPILKDVALENIFIKIIHYSDVKQKVADTRSHVPRLFWVRATGSGEGRISKTFLELIFLSLGKNIQTRLKARYANHHEKPSFMKGFGKLEPIADPKIESLNEFKLDELVLIERKKQNKHKKYSYKSEKQKISGVLKRSSEYEKINTNVFLPIRIIEGWIFKPSSIKELREGKEINREYLYIEKGREERLSKDTLVYLNLIKESNNPIGYELTDSGRTFIEIILRLFYFEAILSLLVNPENIEESSWIEKTPPELWAEAVAEAYLAGLDVNEILAENDILQRYLSEKDNERRFISALHEFNKRNNAKLIYRAFEIKDRNKENLQSLRILEPNKYLQGKIHLGREEFTKKLLKELEKNTPIITVTGSAGVGKTQAIIYALNELKKQQPRVAIYSIISPAISLYDDLQLIEHDLKSNNVEKVFFIVEDTIFDDSWLQLIQYTFNNVIAIPISIILEGPPILYKKVNTNYSSAKITNLYLPPLFFPLIGSFENKKFLWIKENINYDTNEFLGQEFLSAFSKHFDVREEFVFNLIKKYYGNLKEIIKKISKVDDIENYALKIWKNSQEPCGIMEITLSPNEREALIDLAFHYNYLPGKHKTACVSLVEKGIFIEVISEGVTSYSWLNESLRYFIIKHEWIMGKNKNKISPLFKYRKPLQTAASLVFLYLADETKEHFCKVLKEVFYHWFNIYDYEQQLKTLAVLFSWLETSGNNCVYDVVKSYIERLSIYGHTIMEKADNSTLEFYINILSTFGIKEEIKRIYELLKIRPDKNISLIPAVLRSIRQLEIPLQGDFKVKNTINNIYLKIHLKFEEAHKAYNESRFDRALELYKEIELLANKHGDIIDEFNAKLLIGSIFRDQKQYLLAEKKLKEAKTLLEHNKNKIPQIIFNDLNKRLNYFELIHKIMTGVVSDNYFYSVYVYCNSFQKQSLLLTRAMMRLQKNDFLGSKDDLEKALSLNDKDKKYKGLRRDILANLAIVLDYLGETDQVIKIAYEALDLAKRTEYYNPMEILSLVTLLNKNRTSTTKDFEHKKLKETGKQAFKSIIKSGNISREEFLQIMIYIDNFYENYEETKKLFDEINNSGAKLPSDIVNAVKLRELYHTINDKNAFFEKLLQLESVSAIDTFDIYVLKELFYRINDFKELYAKKVRDEFYTLFGEEQNIERYYLRLLGRLIELYYYQSLRTKKFLEIIASIPDNIQFSSVDIKHSITFARDYLAKKHGVVAKAKEIVSRNIIQLPKQPISYRSDDFANVLELIIAQYIVSREDPSFIYKKIREIKETSKTTKTTISASDIRSEIDNAANLISGLHQMIERNQYDRALDEVNGALKKYADIKPLKLELLRIRAIIYRTTWQLNKALKDFFKAYQVAHETKHSPEILHSIMGQITSVYILMGDYLQSITWLQKMSDNNLSSWETKVKYNLLGISYWYSGQFNKAIEAWEKALKFAKEIDKLSSDSKNQIDVLLSLEAAYKYLHLSIKASKIREEINRISDNIPERPLVPLTWSEVELKALDYLIGNDIVSKRFLKQFQELNKKSQSGKGLSLTEIDALLKNCPSRPCLYRINVVEMKLFYLVNKKRIREAYDLLKLEIQKSRNYAPLLLLLYYHLMMLDFHNNQTSNGIKILEMLMKIAQDVPLSLYQNYNLPFLDFYTRSVVLFQVLKPIFSLHTPSGFIESNGLIIEYNREKKEIDKYITLLLLRLETLWPFNSNIVLKTLESHSDLEWNTRLQNSYATYAMIKGDYPKAIKRLKDFYEKNQNNNILFQISMLYLDEGDFRNSGDTLWKFLEFNPSEWNKLEFDLIYIYILGNCKEKIEQLTSNEKLNVRKADMLATTSFVLGIFNHLKGDYKKAEKMFLHSAEKGFLPALAIISLLELKDKDLSLSIQDFKDSLKEKIEEIKNEFQISDEDIENIEVENVFDNFNCFRLSLFLYNLLAHLKWFNKSNYYGKRFATVGLAFLVKIFQLDLNALKSRGNILTHDDVVKIYYLTKDIFRNKTGEKIPSWLFESLHSIFEKKEISFIQISQTIEDLYNEFPAVIDLHFDEIKDLLRKTFSNKKMSPKLLTKAKTVMEMLAHVLLYYEKTEELRELIQIGKNVNLSIKKLTQNYYFLKLKQSKDKSLSQWKQLNSFTKALLLVSWNELREARELLRDIKSSTIYEEIIRISLLKAMGWNKWKEAFIEFVSTISPVIKEDKLIELLEKISQQSSDSKTTSLTDYLRIDEILQDIRDIEQKMLGMFYFKHNIALSRSDKKSINRRLAELSYMLAMAMIAIMQYNLVDFVKQSVIFDDGFIIISKYSITKEYFNQLGLYLWFNEQNMKTTYIQKTLDKMSRIFKNYPQLELTIDIINETFYMLPILRKYIFTNGLSRFVDGIIDCFDESELNDLANKSIYSLSLWYLPVPSNIANMSLKPEIKNMLYLVWLSESMSRSFGDEE